MKQPQYISLGKGSTVKFQDNDSPVHIIYRKTGDIFSASLGYFEENYGTSIDEFDAPPSVIDKFEANADIIYAWEDDYYERNPRD